MDRHTMLQLIHNALLDLELPSSAASLRHEARLPVQPEAARLFSESFYLRDWTQMLSLLSSVNFRSPDTENRIKTKLLALEFIHLIELSKTEQAILLLQEIARSCSISNLKRLSKLCFCRHESDILRCDPTLKLKVMNDVEALMADDAVGCNTLVLPKLETLLARATSCAHNCLIQPGNSSLENLKSHANADWVLQHRFRAHNSGVSTVTFSPTSSDLASGSESGEVTIWKHTDCGYSIFKSFSIASSSVLGLAWSTDGNYLAACSASNVVCWSLPYFEQKYRLTFANTFPIHCRWLHHELLVGPIDNEICVFNESGIQVKSWRLGSISDFVLVKNSIVAAVDCKLVSVHLNVESSPSVIWEGGDSIASLVVSNANDIILAQTLLKSDVTLLSSQWPDSHILVFCTAESSVRNPVSISLGSNAMYVQYGCITSSKDIILGTLSGTILCYDLNGRLHQTLKGHTGIVNVIDFHTSNMLVSAGDDGFITLYERKI